MAASLMSSDAAQAESREETSHWHLVLGSCRRGDRRVWCGRRHVLHGEMAGGGGRIIDLVCGAVIVQVSGGGLWKHIGGDVQ